MKLIDYIHHVLERLQVLEECYFTQEELEAFPENIRKIFLETHFLNSAENQTVIECDGCEEGCLMSVTIQPPFNEKKGRAFITCDKEWTNIGRVPVESIKLKRYYISLKTLSEFIAKLLDLPTTDTIQKIGNELEIGLYQGHKNRRPLKLVQKQDNFSLSLAGHMVSLIDLISLENEKIILNKNKLNYCVDNPQGTNETKSERKKRFNKRIDQLKAEGVKAFIKVLANEEGVSESAIKKVLYS